MALSSQCICNCFHKVGSVEIDKNDAVLEASQQGETELQQCVNTELNFVSADKRTDITEPFTDEGIVNVARMHDAEDSDEGEVDEDVEAPPAEVGTLATTNITALKQPVCIRGLRDEYLGVPNKLETAIIGFGFVAQARITGISRK